LYYFLFLFFNTTTKTQKAEEIFNRFSEKNKVFVRGDIMIDGEEYILVRTIERKLSKYFRRLQTEYGL
jgi:predicted nucleic-acid-binding protein